MIRQTEEVSGTDHGRVLQKLYDLHSVLDNLRFEGDKRYGQHYMADNNDPRQPEAGA